jgi:hypothetical protein
MTKTRKRPRHPPPRSAGKAANREKLRAMAAAVEAMVPVEGERVLGDLPPEQAAELAEFLDPRTLPPARNRQPVDAVADLTWQPPWTPQLSRRWSWRCLTFGFVAPSPRSSALPPLRLRPVVRARQALVMRQWERTFMNRVATGELAKRLRNSVTDQLTENPERRPLGVLSFPASFGKGLRAAGGCSLGLRAPDRRSNSGDLCLWRRQWARSSPFLWLRTFTS